MKTLINYDSFILRNATNAPTVVGTLVPLCFIIMMATKAVAFIIYKRALFRKMINLIGSSAQPGENPTSFFIEAINSNLLHNLFNLKDKFDAT